ncbi:MAG: HAMP domain-containing protein [Planctomycetes bacterium]|nr:HAMP domain-containing protein [Planctomycetota bacterium]
MNIGTKLTGAFIAISLLGTVVGAVAYLVNSESQEVGRKNVILGEENAKTSEENAKLSQNSSELSKHAINLSSRAYLYNSLRKEISDSILKSSGEKTEGDPIPLQQYVQTVQEIFVYNLPELVARKDRLGIFLFGSGEEVEKRLKAYGEKADDEDEDETSNGLDLFTDDTEPAESAKENKAEAKGDNGDAKASFADFLNSSRLKKLRDELKTQAASSSSPGVQKKYGEIEQNIAASLEAIEEPYFRLLTHSARIGELWRQRHINDMGYDLLDQIQAMLESHRTWCENLQLAVYRGEQIDIETNVEQSPIGSWAPSTFCRSFRKNWALFDQTMTEIEKTNGEIFASVTKITKEESPETRQSLYEKEVYPKLKQIDNKFARIKAEEETLAGMQAKARRVLKEEFLPALSDINNAIDHAMETITLAEASVRSEQNDIQRASILAEDNRRTQELARVGRERENIPVLKKQLNKQVQANRFIGALIAISFLAAVGLGVAFSKNITGKIRKVATLAEDISMGELSGRLPSLGTDEIGQLATAVNRMADGLEAKANFAETLAGGDLTAKVPRTSERDAFAKALESMRSGIHSVVSEVEVTATEAATGSEQLKGSSLMLARGADRQADDIRESSMSMTHMTDQVRANAEHAAKASTLAREVLEATTGGVERLSNISRAMAGLEESSKRIGKITKVIDKISAQTKLLAINASVEAVRAGKYGHGFMVVANEIRNLADSSAREAKAISESIGEAMTQIESGAKTVRETQGYFDKIYSGVNDTSTFIGEIADACGHQTKGVDSIRQSLSHIDEVTRQNTANATITSESAENLDRNISRLRYILSRFKTSAGNGMGMKPGIHNILNRDNSNDWTLAQGKTNAPDLRLLPKATPLDFVLDEEEFDFTEDEDGGLDAGREEERNPDNVISLL